jgi:TonB family protein
MTKPIISLILSLVLYLSSYAQQGGLIYYLKNNGKLVSNKDSADYSMVVLPPDTSVDKNLYVVYEYDKSGNIRLLTGSKTKDFDLQYQGGYTKYYPNGRKKTVGTYENGTVKGREVAYYPNGKLHYSKTFKPYGKIFYGENRDSTGAVLAENGNGKWKEFDDSLKYVTIEGEVDSGKKIGIWHVRKNDSTIQETEYTNGELRYEKYIYKSGRENYFKFDVAPEFPGGIEMFFKFVSKNVRYPARARENGTQGKVIVSFTIRANGSIADTKVVRGVGDGIDEEAVRVLKLSPAWKPGFVKGKAVSVAFSVPISFSLGR